MLVVYLFFLTCHWLSLVNYIQSFSSVCVCVCISAIMLPSQATTVFELVIHYKQDSTVDNIVFIKL